MGNYFIKNFFENCILQFFKTQNTPSQIYIFCRIAVAQEKRPFFNILKNVSEKWFRIERSEYEVTVTCSEKNIYWFFLFFVPTVYYRK